MQTVTFKHGGSRYQLDVQPYKKGSGRHFQLWLLLGRSGAGLEVSFGNVSRGKMTDYAGDPPRVTPDLIQAAQTALDAS